MRRTLDLNADVGESFGHWRYAHTERLVALLTTAHVACGWHAGDPSTMRQVIRWCRQYGVAVAAHPGLPDLQGFGRRAMELDLDEAYDMIVYQVGALKAFARLESVPVRIASSHGAFSAWENASASQADCMIRALRDSIGGDLVLYLPPHPYEPLLAAAAAHGVPVIHEFYPGLQYNDLAEPTFGRTFDESGEVPRTLAIVEGWLDTGLVETDSGQDVRINADAIRFHGDVSTAPDVVAGIRRLCAEREILIQNVAGQRRPTH